MATQSRYLFCIGLGLGIVLSGCATHQRIGCVGDAQTLGYRDGSQGQHACEMTLSGAAKIAYQDGWNEGIQRFCTEENGYQQGCQGASFANVCPDALASTYLDGYQSGYSIYLMQLEVDAMERSIESKSTELEQVWSSLDEVASNLEQSDLDPRQRARWLDQSHALTTKQSKIGAEIDEMEAEVSARKAQLTQMRHAIAISD